MAQRPHRRSPNRSGPAAGKKTQPRQRVANQASRDSQVLAVNNRRVPLMFLPNKRARQIIIRVDHGRAGIVVVLPPRSTRDQGRRFALLNKGWIRDRLAQLPARVAFRPGAVIPFLGVEHRIRHRPRAQAQAQGTVWREGGTINVAGRAEHVARRVEDWLKREARREIERRVRQKAEAIERRVGGLTVRDPKSRWGSCSPSAKLSFSWRLVLAPRSVLDYVVAHEVAHLKELNHGRRFWRLCAELTRDAETARAWLNQHGPALHRYG